MTQSNRQTNHDPAAQSDPLMHLYKMSTTAGLGSTEYVEVNVTAVVAVLFGLASLLAMVNKVLLIIPLVGVILALVAMKQIRGSNGTQTGRGWALLGLVLSGLITAGILSFDIVQKISDKSDEDAIAALCQKYGQLLGQGKYDQAYDLFDDGFKARVSLQTFKVDLMSIAGYNLVPPIEQVTWDGLVKFQSDDEGGRTAATSIVVHLHGWAGFPRLEAHFRRAKDGPWQIDAIPEQFPAPKPSGSSR